MTPHNFPSSEDLLISIQESIAQALKEDVGSGDITAQLIPFQQKASARVITREAGIFCGRYWVEQVFSELNKELPEELQVCIDWQVEDGSPINADQCLFELKGSARTILTGERIALNFVQTLSGTATISHQYAQLVKDTSVTLLDTRKTIPGMRLAQKYAVTCGGCKNHRLGLYDAFLIKENHIMACGSIANSVEEAKRIAPGKPVEIEVEDYNEFLEALEAGADIIMLDNFDLDTMTKAVEQNQGKVKLEASGGITNQTLVPIANTGVDFISIGALTKDCKSLDLSLRLIN